MCIKHKSIFNINGLRNVIGMILLVSTLGVYSGEGANVTLGVGNLSATATVTGAMSIELRVAGPGDYYASQHSMSGSVNWYAPPGLSDGEYRYEIYVTTGSDTESVDNTQLYRDNGRFKLEGGVLSTIVASPPPEPQAAADIVQSPSLITRIARGVLDFIVPEAQAADVNIIDISPELFFSDTDVVGVDWRMTGDDFSAGFYNYDTTHYIWFINDDTPFYAFWGEFSWSLYNFYHGGNSIFIDTTSGPHVLFADSVGDIELADNSVFIDKSADRLGVGTTMPSDELHIVNVTPGVRLDDGITGVWKIEEFSDDLRITDVTDGIISLTLDGANGQIGMGTVTPDSALHVFRNDGSASLKVEETGVFASRVLQRLKNNGPTALYLEDSSATGGTWSFTMNYNNFVINNVAANGLKIVAGADNTYRVQNKGSGVETMKVAANGNMVIAGLLTTGSSRSIKDNINTVEHSSILTKLDQLPVSYWNYITTDADDRHIGPMAEDFYNVFALGNSDRYIAPSDLAGIALAAAKALNEKSVRKGEQINKLSKENNKLKLRIQALELKMADLIQNIAMKDTSINTMASAQ